MAKQQQKKPIAKPAPKKPQQKTLQQSNRDSNPLVKLAASLDKEFGEGTILYGDAPLPNVEFMSTGIPDLDAAMGGGVARGRIIELFGVESSGKTTTCLTMVATCQQTYFEEQKRYGVCAYIDAEHAIDPTWAKNLGVSMRDLLFNQPDSGEQAFRIINTLAKSGLVDLIVVDSVAALVPREEPEGEAGDTRIGAQARLMSQGLRILKGTVNKSHCAVCFINQIRNKIGVMYGSPETTSGGTALKFYASTRIEMRRAESIKEGDTAIAMKTKVKIPKNKVAPPFRTAEYIINFGVPDKEGRKVFGIDKIDSLFDSALLHKVIVQSGSWFSFDGQKIGLGKEKSLAAMRGDADLAKQIRERLMEVSRPEPDDIKPETEEEFDEDLNNKLDDVEIPATVIADEEEDAADDRVGPPAFDRDGGESTEEMDLTTPVG